MGAWKNLTLVQKRKLEQCLADELCKMGYDATVELESDKWPGCYHLFVVSSTFEKLFETDRQNILWRALRERWSWKDHARLTLAIALSDKESQER